MKNKKRLIDANLVIDRLKTNIVLGATEQAFLRNYVNCCPTVDAVEVVRCKDCKHYDETDSFNCEFAFMKLRRPDDFCSCGERKVGDGNG